jgi:hypothetical protein
VCMEASLSVHRRTSLCTLKEQFVYTEGPVCVYGWTSLCILKDQFVYTEEPVLCIEGQVSVYGSVT